MHTHTHTHTHTHRIGAVFAADAGCRYLFVFCFFVLCDILGRTY
jgi:hypothetical protein